MDVRFITVERVAELNSEEIGVDVPMNILKPNELESAVMSVQQSMFGEYLYKDVFEMSANLLLHLAMNHSFIDANKRTACFACLEMLEMNGYDLNESLDIEYCDIVLDVVNHRKEVTELIEFLKNNCTTKDNVELTDEEIQNSLIINEKIDNEDGSTTFKSVDSMMEYIENAD